MPTYLLVPPRARSIWPVVKKAVAESPAFAVVAVVAKVIVMLSGI